MSNLPKADKVQFISFSERRKELAICSRVEHWYSHWDVNAGQSRRCGGARCALCQIGSPKVLRFVVMGIDEHGREWLVEMRERHRDIAEKLDDLIQNGQGHRLVGRKEGPARNSPVSLVLAGPVEVYRREITRLVERLGLPALNANPLPSRNDDLNERGGVNVDEPPLQRSYE